MKILISDYQSSMMPSHDYEIAILKAGIPNAEIIIHEYNDKERRKFLNLLADADALLTAFVKIDKSALENSPKLKIISLNATGYDNIDVATATKCNVGVSPVGEYCSVDVAEHTLAIMLALNKNLKAYAYDLEKNHHWCYSTPEQPDRIESQTLGIFGLGKIGRCVAKLAGLLGMRVIATDPSVTAEIAQALNVELVAADEIYAQADVITNHMNLEHTNVAYFTQKEFEKMKRSPIFLNLGRGLSVDEHALVTALDKKLIRAAGLDVLIDETPCLADHPLLNLSNVIVTPHSAFYSRQSMSELQRYSCENIVNYITGKKQQVFKLINPF